MRKVVFATSLWIALGVLLPNTAVGTEQTVASLQELETKIGALEKQLQDLKYQLEAQKDVLSISQSLHERSRENLVQSHESQLTKMESTYSTSVKHIEVISYWFLGFFSILGVVTFFLGMPALKKHLESALFESLKPHAESVAAKAIGDWDGKVRDLIIKYETLFAEKYKEYSNLGG